MNAIFERVSLSVTLNVVNTSERDPPLKVETLLSNELEVSCELDAVDAWIGALDLTRSAHDLGVALIAGDEAFDVRSECTDSLSTNSTWLVLWIAENGSETDAVSTIFVTSDITLIDCLLDDRATAGTIGTIGTIG